MNTPYYIQDVSIEIMVFWRLFITWIFMSNLQSPIPSLIHDCTQEVTPTSVAMEVWMEVLSWSNLSIFLFGKAPESPCQFRRERSIITEGISGSLVAQTRGRVANTLLDS